MKYYHATFAKSMESIMKNGLVPSNGKDLNWSESETAGFVFLATDEEIALDFVETCDKAKNGDKFVCFEVDGDEEIMSMDREGIFNYLEGVNFDIRVDYFNRQNAMEA